MNELEIIEAVESMAPHQQSALRGCKRYGRVWLSGSNPDDDASASWRTAEVLEDRYGFVKIERDDETGKRFIRLTDDGKVAAPFVLEVVSRSVFRKIKLSDERKAQAKRD